jgi:hypothetical protein
MNNRDLTPDSAAGRIAQILRWAREPLWVLVFAALWFWIALLLVARGMVWPLIEPLVADTRVFSLEAQLFALPAKRHYRRLFIGDRLFGESLGSEFDADKDLLIAIPWFSFGDLKAVSAAVQRLKPKLVVVQASPHLWSDYAVQAPALDTSLWMWRVRRPAYSVAPMRYLLSLVPQVLTAREGDDGALPERPGSLLGTHWTDAPKGVRSVDALLTQSARVVKAPVRLLVDCQALPADIPGALLEDFYRLIGDAPKRLLVAAGPDIRSLCVAP